MKGIIVTLCASLHCCLQLSTPSLSRIMHPNLGHMMHVAMSPMWWGAFPYGLVWPIHWGCKLECGSSLLNFPSAYCVPIILCEGVCSGRPHVQGGGDRFGKILTWKPPKWLITDNYRLVSKRNQCLLLYAAETWNTAQPYHSSNSRLFTMVYLFHLTTCDCYTLLPLFLFSFSIGGYCFIANTYNST